MKLEDIKTVIEKLKVVNREFKKPIVTQVAESNNPYKVLVSTVLSLRTKDETTKSAFLRLLEEAPDVYSLSRLKEQDIEALIYPVGFYRVKAKNLRRIAKLLVDKYRGKIPDSFEELIKLPNVGRKTANLVLAKGYNIPAICVDVHVHRITNRLGLVDTRTPEETEFALAEILPREHWIEFNDLLVPFGQNICRPVSPICSVCPIYEFCDRRGVRRRR